MSILNRFTAIAGAALLSVGFAGSANAGTAVSGQMDLTGGDTLIEDTSGELVYDWYEAGNCPLGGAGGCWAPDDDTNLDVGDVLAGVVNIDRINGTSIGNGSGVNELTGAFAIQLTSAIDGPDIFQGGASDAWSLTFGAVSGSAFTDIFGIAAPTDANTAISFFEDSSPDFNVITDVPTGYATSTDGIWRANFGFGAGSSWTALGPVDLTEFASYGPAALLGIFNFQLNLLSHSWGFDFLTAYCGVELCGSGSLYQPNASFAFPVQDDFQATINVVPEPGTLGILGMGLLGLGAAGRRRRS